MKKKSKKLESHSFTFVVIIISMIILLNAFMIFYSIGKQSHTSREISALAKDSAKIRVQVLEQNTNKPIDGATVCIIETRHYENTNKNGYTSIIEVPIIRNTNFDISHSRTWGELTILVYKSGYADSITFYTSITPNATNLGTVIFLSPIISSSDIEPDIITESPNNAWAKHLIKLYKKRI